MLWSELDGKEIQGRGDVYMHAADSLRCAAERDTTSQSSQTRLETGGNVAIITKKLDTDI